MAFDRDVVASLAGIERLTDAILDDEPDAEEAIGAALASGAGMTVKTLDQSWLPDSALLWVAIGEGRSVFVRYLLVREHGLALLTGRPAAFNAAFAGHAEPVDSEDALLEYGLLYLELTRTMDEPCVLLGREPDASPHHAVALEALRGPIGDQVERVWRLHRLTRASNGTPLPLPAARSVLVAVAERGLQVGSALGPVEAHLLSIGFDRARVDELRWLRRLPAGALSRAEHALLRQALRALPPAAVASLEELADGVEFAWVREGRRVRQPDDGLRVARPDAGPGTDSLGGGRVAGPDEAWSSPHADSASGLELARAWIGDGAEELPRARREGDGGVVDALVGVGQHVDLVRLRVDGAGRVDEERLRIL